MNSKKVKDADSAFFENVNFAFIYLLCFPNTTNLWLWEGDCMAVAEPMGAVSWSCDMTMKVWGRGGLFDNC